VTATIDALHDVLTSRFETLVETPQSVPTAYDNMPFTKPTNSKWARWTVKVGSTNLIEIGSTLKTYRRIGVAIASLFVPINDGIQVITTLADVVETSFRTLTVSGVKFGTPTPTVVGGDGQWFQMNVSCPFEVDFFA
jgi:hypothetical protein